MMRDAAILGERTVTVERERLLATLKTNRTKHQAEYNESLAGYKSLATQRLKTLRDKAVRTIDENFELITRKIERYDPADRDITDVVTLLSAMTFNLKVPTDHTHAYDVAIDMAEWETNATIELTQGQFQCFVRDEWDWTDEFKHLNKAYTSMGR